MKESPLTFTIIVALLVGFGAGVFGSQLGPLVVNPLVNEANDLFGPQQNQEQQRTEETQEYNATAPQEDRIIDVVREASPAVVSVIVTKDLPILEREYVNPFGDDPFFEDFGFRVPRLRERGTEEREVGGGTGFVVSADGLIVTNRHVVADKEADYTVLTNDGERLAAEVVARDPIQDLALLKINGTNLPTLPLGDSDSVAVGQTVITIGNALGEFRNTVSTGIVSGLARSLQASGGTGVLEQLDGVIQTDAAVNQGNSGGPLLNLRGEVIGVNTALAIGAENIGFALPVNRVKKMMRDVREHGRVIYPFLGVRYVVITPELQRNKQLPVDYGALILRGEEPTDLAVVPGGAADKAGLRENDIILTVNGERITEENPLSRTVLQYNVGDTVTLTVLRQGEEMTAEATLQEFQQ